MKIGAKIAKVLREKGWSGARLAALVDVSPATISRIIRGGDTASALALSIARALDVRLESLVDDEAQVEAGNSAADVQLSSLPDLSLVRLVDARVSRLIVEQKQALTALRSRRKSGEKAAIAPDEREQLTQAMLRHGASASTYGSLLHCLVNLGRIIREVDVEMTRILGVGVPAPPAEELSAAEAALDRIESDYRDAETTPPWRRERPKSVPREKKRGRKRDAQ